MGVNDFLKLLKEDMNFETFEGESVLQEDEPIVEQPDIEEPEEEFVSTKLPNMVDIDPKFVSSLIKYVDKMLPDYESFNNALGVEIRKYMDTSDQTKVVKVKQKIHKILMSEKLKFLEKVRKRVSAVQVLKKV